VHNFFASAAAGITHVGGRSKTTAGVSPARLPFHRRNSWKIHESDDFIGIFCISEKHAQQILKHTNCLRTAPCCGEPSPPNNPADGGACTQN
jgi:hypothetical protein